MGTTLILISLFALTHAGIHVPGFDPVSEPVTSKEYLNMTYVYFGEQKLTFFQAHKHCLRHGMELVDVPTKEIFEWVAKTLIPSDTVGVNFVTSEILSWTALNDLFAEGTFTNLYTGRVHTQGFYNAEEYHGGADENVGGNNRDGNQHCSTIEVFVDDPKNWFLNDFYCEWSVPFVCQIPTRLIECQPCATGASTECKVCPTALSKRSAEGGAGGGANACTKCIKKMLKKNKAGSCSKAKKTHLLV